MNETDHYHGNGLYLRTDACLRENKHLCLCARARERALMTRKSCAVGMRIAILRNHLKRCHDRPPGSVTRLLNELQWPSFAKKPDSMSMSMGRYDSPPDSEYVKHRQRAAKQYNLMTFTHLTPASNTYKFSFYARTIPEWNSLPAEVIDQASVEAFRASLVSFYPNSDLVTFISFLGDDDSFGQGGLQFIPELSRGELGI